jgi:hypothetical protein
MLALLSPVLAPGGAAACERGRVCTSSRPIHVPSPEYPTIQAAIDAAPDGGTILVAPGTYLEQLVVQGKTVSIIGSEDTGGTAIVGTRPRELLPVDNVVGLLNYRNGGGGVLRDLRLDGGDAAIVGRDVERQASDLEIRDVQISASGRGILWESSATVAVKDSNITDTLGNGISLLKGLLIAKYMNTLDAGGAGIYIQGGSVKLYNVLAGFNASAGIFSDYAVVLVYDSSVFNNTGAGIWAVHSALGAYNTSAYSNEALPNGQFGYGFAGLVSPLVELSTVVSSDNDQAGIGNFGSHVKLGDSEFSDNAAFDFLGIDIMAGQLGPGDPPTDQPYEFENAGNNHCFTGAVEHGCTLETVGVQPPQMPIVDP